MNFTYKQPYVTWKGPSTGSAVPTWSRPLINDNTNTNTGTSFAARPIKHWRKQLVPAANTGISKNAGVGMPMDRPGGSSYLGATNDCSNCPVNLYELIPKKTKTQSNNIYIDYLVNNILPLTGLTTLEINQLISLLSSEKAIIYGSSLLYAYRRTTLINSVPIGDIDIAINDLTLLNTIIIFLTNALPQATLYNNDNTNPNQHPFLNVLYTPDKSVNYVLTNTGLPANESSNGIFSLGNNNNTDGNWYMHDNREYGLLNPLITSFYQNNKLLIQLTYYDIQSNIGDYIQNNGDFTVGSGIYDGSQLIISSDVDNNITIYRELINTSSVHQDWMLYRLKKYIDRGFVIYFDNKIQIDSWNSNNWLTINNLSQKFVCPFNLKPVGYTLQWINTTKTSSDYFIKYNPECNPECNPETNIIKSGITLLNNNYYSDTKAYLQSLCQTYDQKLSTIPIPGNSYINPTTHHPIPPSDSPTGSQAYYTENCSKKCATENSFVRTVYKPNNQQYAQQGAVSSSSRLTRLKYNTITQNGNSFKSASGQQAANAGKYQGTSDGSYFLKTKNQECVPTHRSGNKTKSCSVTFNSFNPPCIPIEIHISMIAVNTGGNNWSVVENKKIEECEILTIKDNITLTINIGARLTVLGTLNNNGTIINNGIISSAGIINNKIGGEIINNVEINNVRTIINNGTIENTGTITNRSEGADNTIIYAIINNNGTITNTGQIYNDNSIIENSGLIANNGQMYNVNGRLITNTGIINNTDLIDNANGEMNNENQITNNGNINNGVDGTITNNGIINNNNSITNINIINNSGTIENTDGDINNNTDGKININAGGYLNNNSGGIINNYGGTITTNIFGTIINNNGATIYNSNNGTIDKTYGAFNPVLGSSLINGGLFSLCGVGNLINVTQTATGCPP